MVHRGDPRYCRGHRNRSTRIRAAGVVRGRATRAGSPCGTSGSRTCAERAVRPARQMPNRPSGLRSSAVPETIGGAPAPYRIPSSAQLITVNSPPHISASRPLRSSMNSRMPCIRSRCAAEEAIRVGARDEHIRCAGRPLRGGAGNGPAGRNPAGVCAGTRLSAWTPVSAGRMLQQLQWSLGNPPRRPAAAGQADREREAGATLARTFHHYANPWNWGAGRGRFRADSEHLGPQWPDSSDSGRSTPSPPGTMTLPGVR